MFQGGAPLCPTCGTIMVHDTPRGFRCIADPCERRAPSISFDSPPSLQHCDACGHLCQPSRLCGNCGAPEHLFQVLPPKERWDRIRSELQSATDLSGYACADDEVGYLDAFRREHEALLELASAVREDLPEACIGCRGNEPLDENGKHVIPPDGKARWQCRMPRTVAALQRLDGERAPAMQVWSAERS